MNTLTETPATLQQAFLKCTAITLYCICALALIDHAIHLIYKNHLPAIPLQYSYLSLYAAIATFRLNARLLMLPLGLSIILINQHITHQDPTYINIAILTTLLLSLSAIFDTFTAIKTIRKYSAAIVSAGGIYLLSAHLLDISILDSSLTTTTEKLPRHAGLYLFIGIITLMQLHNKNNAPLKTRALDSASIIGPLLVYALLSANTNINKNYNDVIANNLKDETATIIQARKLQAAAIADAWLVMQDKNAQLQVALLNNLLAALPEISSAYIYDENLNATNTFTPKRKPLQAIAIEQPAAPIARLINDRQEPITDTEYLIQQDGEITTEVAIAYLEKNRQYIAIYFSANSNIHKLHHAPTGTTNIEISLISKASNPAIVSPPPNAIVHVNGNMDLAIHVMTKDTQNIPALAIFIILSSILITSISRINSELYKSERLHAEKLKDKHQELSTALTKSRELQIAASRSEQLYRSLFNDSPDSIILSNHLGKIIDINQSAIELFKFSRDQFINLSVSTLLLSANNKSSSASALPNVKINNFEISCSDNQKRKLTLNVCHFPIHVDQQQTGAFTVARDFSSFRAAQNDSLLRLRALDACSNGIIISNARQTHQPIVYVNAAFERITGYSAHEVIGRNCRFLSKGIKSTKEREILRSAIARGESTQVTIQNSRKDGSLFWNELKIEPIYDEDNTLSHFVGVQTDVTEQLKYIKDLSFYATHDRLTALPNRTLLEDRLEHAYNIAQRYKQLTAVLFIDLDDFKPINDAFGHGIGDEVLKEVSERLRCNARNSDTLARLGGDEYILLLTEISHEYQVTAIAERIIESIDHAFIINDLELHITCSIGISLFTEQLDNAQTLLQQADMAMYRAKQNGRNTYNIYTSDLDQSANDNMQLRNDLRSAIQNDQLLLHYQPQIDGRTGKIAGIEALLRWNHPLRGMISPADFIHLAEANGQIVPIGQWVLEQTCAFIRELLELNLCDCPISINVSPVQLQRQAFDQVVMDALAASGLAAKYLELEITESILLSDMERVLKMLRALNRAGVQIAIDDFGTGFSSLNYLKLLPLNKVKIDKSFINEIIHNPHDAALTKSIISMAHHLSMSVIAEGVEDLAQYTFLLNNKCEYFQGYFFSKPLNRQDLIAYLRANSRGITLPTNKIETPNTLLLIDDEENILRALKRTLRKDNYNILTCTNAQQAFELLAVNNVHVIISDQRMPGMTGTEFLKKVKDIYPNTIRMVLSGFTDLNSVTDAINQGAIYKYLTKPWDDQALSDSIRQAFKQYELQLNTTIRLDTDRQ